MKQNIRLQFKLVPERHIMKLRAFAVSIGEHNFLRFQFVDASHHLKFLNLLKSQALIMGGLNCKLYLYRRILENLFNWLQKVTLSKPRHLEELIPSPTLKVDAANNDELRDGISKTATNARWPQSQWVSEVSNRKYLNRTSNVQCRKQIIRTSIQLFTLYIPWILNHKTDLLNRLRLKGDYSIKEQIIQRKETSIHSGLGKQKSPLTLLDRTYPRSPQKTEEIAINSSLPPTQLMLRQISIDVPIRDQSNRSGPMRNDPSREYINAETLTKTIARKLYCSSDDKGRIRQPGQFQTQRNVPLHQTTACERKRR
ncbi:MAG: hypothetical protein EZS28_014768 [Streblomastix strix]|uniref:Uncharacterized protein n=1 Tax=Streblomastix strix TaxID=222440 RepID=A0A5J4W4T3_9EUKA|nr:MAG: hypothetical protein EZS28_014768 [Streblomastix strix]